MYTLSQEEEAGNEIGQEYGVHPIQVSQSKKDLPSNAGSLFEGKRSLPRTGAPIGMKRKEIPQIAASDSNYRKLALFIGKR